MGARLQKYLFTHNQLQTYLQIFTGQNDVVVLTDSQPQTHVPSKVVGLPIGTPHAATSASHEGLHIMRSTHEAMAAMKNAAERAVLNVLDDGRIERESFRTLPGLRPQFQEDIDDLTNIILKEGWLSQALKGMYLKSVGYDFPYDKLHPKAQAILVKFAGFVPIVRKAESDMELVSLVPKVLALFDEPLDMPEPPQPMPGGNGEPGDDGEAEEWGASDGDNEDGENDSESNGESADSDSDTDGQESVPSKGKSVPKGKPGKGIKGKDPGKALKGADDSDPDKPEPSEAEKALAERMRKGMEKSQTQAEKVKRQHGPVIMSEDGTDLDDEDDDEIYERDGVEYDADEARNRAQAAERLGAEERAGKKRRENVIGGDRVTGGPTVNQLMLQAEKVKKDLDALEAKRKRNSLSALTRARNADEDTGYQPGAGYVPYVPQSIEEDKSEDGVKRARVPKAMRDVAMLPKALDNLAKSGGRSDPYSYYGGPSVNIPIDWTALMGGEHGGTGYHGGSGWAMEDLRAPVRGNMQAAEEAAKKFGPTSNYLARQLRVFMQTDNRKGMRSYERMGLLDPRRSYHMGAGRFDVFRNPPNHSDSSPVVCMTTDTSGSMGGGVGSAAFHAMCSSIVLAQALHKLRIPFEAHSFDSRGGFLKGFSDPLDYRTLGGLSNLMMARGGTSAAEATAVAWVRLLSRPEPRKIVFVVSDGGVAQNTRAMAEAIEAAGGICVGVGIGLGHIGRYFPHSVEVKHASELPAVFARLLRKLLPTGQWAA